MEGNESIILTLLDRPGYGASTASYNLGTSSRATAMIQDNEIHWSVTVQAVDAAGSETKAKETPDPIVYRLTRSGSTDLGRSVTVYYKLAGSAIDFAKAVVAMIPKPRFETVGDYLEGVGRGLVMKAAPFLVLPVPTTARTGSEATKNAVIASYDPPFKKGCAMSN